MPNLLLVDDESLIRESLRATIVRRYGDGIWTFLEADNGRKALETVSGTRIDLILADIKMPLCNGLEMMKKLHTLNYDGDVIVISGFDDYELVRQALKLGASDYLLKPTQEEELVTLLDKVLARIAHTRKVRSVFSTSDKQNHERLRLEQQYQIDQMFGDAAPAAPGCCRVAVLDIFHAAEGLRETSQSYIYDQVNGILQEQQENRRFLQGELNGMWAVVLLAAERESLADVTRLESWLAQMGFRYAVSSTTPVKDCRNALYECRQMIDGYFYNQPKSVAAPAEEPFPYRLILDQAAAALRCLDVESAEKTLRVWFSAVNEERPRVSRVRQELGNFVYRFLDENNAFIRVIGQYTLQNGDIISCINTAEDIGQLCETYIDAWKKYVASYQELNQESEDQYVTHAKEYIAREYSRELTLADVAGEIGLHPNYFSSFFKRKNGKSFVEYLRSVRIQAACELMQSTSLRLYEIAEKVGYKDQVQFMRAFKKETGKTPQQWKTGK